MYLYSVLNKNSLKSKTTNDDESENQVAEGEEIKGSSC